MTPAPRLARPRADGRAPDVVVIGGGIVGCAAAAFLGEAGLRVVLVDRLGVASGASGANSGVIQEPDDDALVPLYRDTLELYRVLSAQDAGFRLPAEPAGLLFVSRDMPAVERLAASIAHRRPAQSPEILHGSSLRALEPALSPDLTACRVLMGHPVPPAASTYAYATLAERRGVTIRTGRRARISIDGARVAGAWIDGTHLPAAAVLVAAGPWTSEVIDPAGTWLPIRRLWGVVVEVELDGPPRHVLEEAGIDAVLTGETELAEPGAAGWSVAGPPVAGPPVAGPPAGHRPVAWPPVAGPPAGQQPVASAPVGELPRGGPLLAREFSLVTAAGISAVGSTFLPAGPDPAAWVEPLVARGATFVPKLAGAPIRGARACARPRSVDGRPLVGAVAGITGLYVCAGHGPWGISTGPATARLVTDLLLGRPVSIPAARDPARFGSPIGGPTSRSPEAAPA